MTGVTVDSIQMPANPNTDTHYTSLNTVGATNATSNSAKTNGNVYLNHIENGSATSTHKITGSGSVTVASDASGNITINAPAIPTVNNGTLTIQKNGSNVATFTANQSGNATANITVPTKVSELTNDSKFLTAHPTISKSTDTTSTATPEHGLTFTAVDSVTRDTNGHVTKINTKTVTLPDAGLHYIAASDVTVTAGSDTSGSYLAAKWKVANVDSITTPTDGMSVAIRTPGAGYRGGILLSIDGGSKYYPIVRNVNTLVTTNYAAGSTLVLTFNSTQTASPYTTAGATSTVTGCWQVADYDANTTYTNASLGQGYGTCSTAAATVAKTATLSSYAATTGGIVSIKFTYAVPASATLNINSKGAKAIWYKGAAIPDGIIGAGEVATFIYDGTRYHLLDVDRIRFLTTLIPYGTSIAANSNLNSTAFLKVGNYYCSKNDDAKTLTNCPSTSAFMMTVYSPLSTTVDNETTGTWVYRVRKMQVYTGAEYIQSCYSNGTAGNWTYGDWYKTMKSNHFAVTSALSSGTEIGSITIDGNKKTFYIPTLATVATSGSYNDLSNKPTIPTVPSSLKSPYSLTIQGNGTTLTNGTYDGSAAKTVNITPAAIGAATSGHTHTDTLQFASVTSNTSVLGSSVTDPSVTYGNGRFVAVSRDALSTGAYSDDGLVWTSFTFPAGSSRRYAVGYGLGKFVCGGQTKNWEYSLDGKTWVNTGVSSTGIGGARGFACSGSRIVAIGSSTTGAYSTDGVSWTTMTLPFTAKSIAYGNGKFVIIANNSSTGSYAAYSVDGVEWTTSTFTGVSCYHVAFGNGRFVAVPYSAGTGAYSDDGITWTAMTTSVGASNGLAFGGGKFVIGASSGTSGAYSTNGSTWTTTTTIACSMEWTGICYGKGRFVTVDGGASSLHKAAISYDGITWSTTGHSVKYNNSDAAPMLKSLLANDETISQYISAVSGGGSGGVKIKTGSYTGTNTYGSGNPCSLTFDFSPQLVIIHQNSLYSGHINYAFFFKPRTVVYCDNNYASNTGINLTWGENSVSWYNASQAKFQLNAATTYSWVAIG